MSAVSRATSSMDGVPNALPAWAVHELERNGFTVMPRVFPPAIALELAHAYDLAVASASTEDTKIGGTSTRIVDFVNRGPAFDDVYLMPLLLDACRRVIGQPFRLSSFHARTLHPRSRSGDLHVDVRRGSADWPLLSFIVMIDDFRPENGATRFVPGSHKWEREPRETMRDVRGDHDGQTLACGPAGSVLIFNGSVWHDHSANPSNAPRRSLQGAFIPRAGQAATDFAARMHPETRARLSAEDRYLLGIE